MITILPAIGITFVALHLLCASLALAIGFAAGVWMCSTKLASSAPSNASVQNATRLANEAKKTAERTMMASSRVMDLARGVAADVGQHSAEMETISNDIQKTTGTEGAVSNVLEQILAANAKLQHRLEKAEQQIEAQAAEITFHESEARTDSLTSLANRRAFDDEMRRRVSEWQRKQTPFSLLMIDIDHFKKFNDTHGHQVGDEVLRQIAKVLLAQTREMDLACRYGGEEFAIILPATKATNACLLAERTLKAIEQSATLCNGKSLKVTASLGLAQIAGKEDASLLIRRADAALYKSKEAGRNCGHWHDLEQCLPIAAPPAKPECDLPAAVPHSTPRIVTNADFTHELKRRAAESQQFGVPLSTIHIKRAGNDKADSGQVDQSILDLATHALAAALRETDLLTQLEHGEFAVLLPGSTESEANQMTKRMRMMLSSSLAPLASGKPRLSFHYGIAQLRKNETNQELLARAGQDAMAGDPNQSVARV